MDEDAEALVDRRLLGDPEDPRELVLERAGQVEAEVGGGEAEHAVAAARQEGLQRGLLTGRDQVPSPARVVLGVEQVGVERGGVELGLLLRGRDLAQQAVDRLDRLRGRLATGALRQRRQLQQLQVAGDRPVDVDRGVQARLGELAAGLPGGFQHLLAQGPVGGVQTLGGAEQLLAVLLLLAPGRGRQGLLVEAGGAGLALLTALEPGEDEAGARRPADPRPVGLALEPEHEDVIEADPLDGVHRHPLDRGGGGRLLAAGRLDPGLCDGAEVGDETAGGAVRLAARPGRGQLGQSREPEQALGDLRLGGEETLAPQADALDQPPHEDVGAALLHRRRGGVVELEEGLDPLARLGLELGAVEGGLAGGDHVLLAAPGDRRQPRQVAGAQFDRRPGQRPRHRRRVVGIGQRPQPGDRVANLGPLEERRGAGEVEGDAALLHRRRHRAALAGRLGDEHADLLRLGAADDQLLDLAGDGLGLGALVRALPEPDRWFSEAMLQNHNVAAGVEVAEPGAGGLGGVRWGVLRAGEGVRSRTPRWPPLGSRAWVRVLERVEVVGVVGGEGGQDCALSWGCLLELVDHQVLKLVGDLAAGVGAFGEEAVEGEEDVAAVEAAGAGEDAVVGCVEFGELEVAAGRLTLRLVGRRLLPLAGQGLQLGRAHPLRLQLVDPAQ